MNDRPIIGLDLGGTYIKGVLVDENGLVKSKVTLETNAQEGSEQVIERLCSAVHQLCDRAGTKLEDTLGIGLGSPGPLDIRRGIVLRSVNLPGWDMVPLRDRLASLTRRTVVMTNDANSAAFGEFWLGAGKGALHICLLTLGTGVGGGVIVAGELLHGHFDNAGELGHMIVMPGEGQCGCGQLGCLEVHASASHLVAKATRAAQRGESETLKKFLETNEAITVPDILASAKNGDEVSRTLWDRACGAIAIACVNLQHTFNPQIILLGGGMAGAGSALLGPVQQHFDQLVWNLAKDQPELRLTSLGGDAGALGAAGWFLHQNRRGAV